MKKRNRLQIIHDILKCIQERNGRIKPTHILYKSNLSHTMLEEYLNELKKKNFLKEHEIEQSKTYSLTDKGFEFLEKYKLIVDFIDSFGLG